MILDFGDDIYAFDAKFEREGFAAVYILKSHGRAAILETAHNASLPLLSDALTELGLDDSQIDLVLLTHVHLDHAGGAGSYMRGFPNASLVVHERGSRHMINPEKLLAGARAVYGAEETERMYGELVPVDEARVTTPADGEEISFGGRKIICLDTPGHAKHHLSYHDVASGSVFTGDVFGMAYAGLSTPERRGIVPTTSPVQFDPAEMLRSVDRIARLGPKRIFPTHFGEVRDVKMAASDMRRMIDAHVRAAVDSGGEEENIRKLLGQVFEEECKIQGWPLCKSEVADVLAPVVWMNAQGLAVWREKDGKRG